MIGITYFAWWGAFALALLTWSDVRTGKVDERRNYFMLGIAMSLLSHFTRPWWYVFALLGTTILIMGVLHLTRSFGSGDFAAFSWLVFGFGLHSFKHLIIWLVCIVGMTIPYIILCKVRGKTPYYPAILASFIIASTKLQMWGL